METQIAAPRRGLAPAHPGEILKTIVLPALREEGTPTSKVAELLGVGRQTLYDLTEQRRPVSPEMALRLAKLLGNSPEHWMALQTAYDLWQARARLADGLEGIPTLPRPAEAA